MAVRGSPAGVLQRELAGGAGTWAARRSPSEPYLSVLYPGQAHGGGEERAAVHGAGAILAVRDPAGAPWLKYSVMSGGGAEEDVVKCPRGSASLFLPMVSGAVVQGLTVCRQARLGALERHVHSRSHPSPSNHL